jgi:ligand-binding SRPBCC domain-containing protein
MYSFQFEQKFTKPAALLWDFMSRPQNLNDLTPDFLDFNIISELPEKVYNGLIIEYMIKLPILGLTNWVTEIKHIEEGIRFIDEQRFGPYKFWYHEHEIIRVDSDSCIMRDKIHYDLNFLFLNGIINKLFVKNNILKIFEFRESKLKEIF